MKRKSTAGSTMVEVLVAFVVVSLLVTLFARAVSVSAHILKLSRTVEERTEAFDLEYYTEDRKLAEPGGLSLYGDGVRIALPQGALQVFEGSGGMKRYYIAYERAGVRDEETG